MSAGEGLDEAAKDAADIAAFFKSGKSERGESGSGRAPVTLLVGSVVAVPHCCQKGQKKNADWLHRGKTRLALWTCPEKCTPLVIIYHVSVQ